MVVCLQCGVEGWPSALVFCIKCLEVPVHRYCLDEIPKSVEEWVPWVCDFCEADSPARAHQKSSAEEVNGTGVENEPLLHSADEILVSKEDSQIAGACDSSGVILRADNDSIPRVVVTKVKESQIDYSQQSNEPQGVEVVANSDSNKRKISPENEINKKRRGTTCFGFFLKTQVPKVISQYTKGERKNLMIKNLSQDYTLLTKEEKGKYEVLAKQSNQNVNINNSESDDEERNVQTRTSLPKIMHLNKFLTVEQKEAVKSIGFGSILHLDCKQLRIQLCKWMANRFDVRRKSFNLHGKIYDFTVHDVEQILGLANQGLPLPLHDPKDDLYMNLDETFGSGDVIPYHILNQKLDGNKSHDDEFKRLYILYVIGYFLCPATEVGVRKNVLHALKDANTIGQYNWAKYVYDMLVEGLTEYKNSKRKRKSSGVYMKGCMFILMILFLDNVNVFQKKVHEHNVIPSISYWINKKISKKLNLLRDYQYPSNCFVLEKIVQGNEDKLPPTSVYVLQDEQDVTDGTTEREDRISILEKKVAALMDLVHKNREESKIHHKNYAELKCLLTELMHQRNNENREEKNSSEISRLHGIERDISAIKDFTKDIPNLKDLIISIMKPQVSQEKEIKVEEFSDLCETGVTDFNLDLNAFPPIDDGNLWLNDMGCGVGTSVYDQLSDSMTQ